MDEPAREEEDVDTEDASEDGQVVLDLSLYNAVKDDDLAGIEAALRNGSNLECRCGRIQETPLYAACRRGNLVIIRMLLDAGARVNSRNRFEETPLHIACIFDHLEVVKELIRRGADIFAMDDDDDTPFDCVSENGKECLLQHFREKFFEQEGRCSLLTLLQQRMDPNWTQTNIALPVGKLEVGQFISILRFFVVQEPGSIRAQCRDGELPIHLACRRHFPLSVIQFLVEQDPSMLLISNNDGSLPIHLACQAVVLLSVIQFLVEQDPSTLHISDTAGRLPIHLACQADVSLQVIRYLVRDNDPGFIHVRDNSGDLPLHVACANHRTPLAAIQFLVEQDSATLHFANNYGALPIHVACKYLTPNIKYLVEENGGAATLCARDHDGALPLHTLCQFSGFALQEVKLLIKFYPGALSTRTRSGDLPVTLACRAAAPLQVIYTLVRGDPQIIVEAMM